MSRYGTLNFRLLALTRHLLGFRVRRSGGATPGQRRVEPTQFERVASAFTDRLDDVYMGTSPRAAVNGSKFVFTASEFEAWKVEFKSLGAPKWNRAPGECQRITVRGTTSCKAGCDEKKQSAD